jgi:hypothetical protein
MTLAISSGKRGGAEQEACIQLLARAALAALAERQAARSDAPGSVRDLAALVLDDHSERPPGSKKDEA